MKNYTIAVLPGDGVGPEVVAEGLKVIHNRAGGNAALIAQEIVEGLDSEKP